MVRRMTRRDDTMFMHPKIEFGAWATVTYTTGDSQLIPAEYANDAAVVGDDVESVEIAPGWACRLSAPGFMDATDWSGPFETEGEAAADLRDTYFADCACDDCDDCRTWLDLDTLAHVASSPPVTPEWKPVR